MKRAATRALVAAAAAATALSVSSCSGGREAVCEDAFAEAALSVEGVAAAEWDCSFQFGGGWVRGTVVVEGDTEAEAVTVMEAVLLAFAASPDLEDGWSTPQEYENEDRSIVVGAGELGFSAVPNVAEVREHFGVAPD
jgi:hypothetical protein